MRRCPYCQFRYPDSVQTCVACGKALTIAAPELDFQEGRVESGRPTIKPISTIPPANISPEKQEDDLQPGGKPEADGVSRLIIARRKRRLVQFLALFAVSAAALVGFGVLNKSDKESQPTLKATNPDKMRGPIPAGTVAEASRGDEPQSQAGLPKPSVLSDGRPAGSVPIKAPHSPIGLATSDPALPSSTIASRKAHQESRYEKEVARLRQEQTEARQKEEQRQQEIAQERQELEVLKAQQVEQQRQIGEERRRREELQRQDDERRTLEAEQRREEEGKKQIAPRYTGLSSGEIVWIGEVRGVQLVTIDKDHSDVGTLQGSLPGVLCIIQPVDQRRVSVASTPGPRNNYERLVLRVTGNGTMHVVIKWSLQ